MISKNILSLVLKYNEDGVFIHLNYEVHWFNGKQIQYWCRSNREIFTYKKDLYSRDSDQRYIYKNSKFVPVEFLIKHRLFSLVNNITYHIGNDFVFQTNSDKILAQKKHKFAGFHMCYKNDFIYVFSSYENEKYDIKLNIWSEFSNMEIIKFVCEFNGIIYGFLSLNRYKIYDDKLDKWSDDIVI